MAKGPSKIVAYLPVSTDEQGDRLEPWRSLAGPGDPGRRQARPALSQRRVPLVPEGEEGSVLRPRQRGPRPGLSSTYWPPSPGDAARRISKRTKAALTAYNARGGGPPAEGRQTGLVAITGRLTPPATRASRGGPSWSGACWLVRRREASTHQEGDTAASGNQTD